MTLSHCFEINKMNVFYNHVKKTCRIISACTKLMTSLCDNNETSRGFSLCHFIKMINADKWEEKDPPCETRHWGRERRKSKVSLRTCSAHEACRNSMVIKLSALSNVPTFVITSHIHRIWSLQLSPRITGTFQLVLCRC